MIKRTIKETVHEFDVEGKLIRETITETVEDDDTVYFPPYNPTPYTPLNTPSTWWVKSPTCTIKQ